MAKRPKPADGSRTSDPSGPADSDSVPSFAAGAYTPGEDGISPMFAIHLASIEAAKQRGEKLDPRNVLESIDDAEMHDAITADAANRLRAIWSARASAIKIRGRFAGAPHPGVNSRIRAGITWTTDAPQEHEVTEAQLEELRADPHLELQYEGKPAQATHTPTAVSREEHEELLANLHAQVLAAEADATRRIQELVRKNDDTLQELHAHHATLLAEKDQELADLRARVAQRDMFPHPEPGTGTPTPEG